MKKMIIRELSLSEISGVTKPAQEGALALIEKSKKEDTVPTITESLQKALAPDATDDRRTVERKAVLKSALASGAVSADAVTAELVIFAKAAELRKAAAVRGEMLSPEIAMCRVLELEPDLYNAIHRGI